MLCSNLSKRRAVRATSALLLAVSVAAPAFGESFVGHWIATAETPGGGVSETLKVVKIDGGYEITAKLVEPVPGAQEAGPGTDIVIDGDRFILQGDTQHAGWHARDHLLGCRVRR